MPTSEGLNPDTRFLSPSNILTVTVPGTASRVITVGSYNSRTDVVSAFSGRGDTMQGIFKPDLLAPGENIVSYLVGGTTGALTGTSMATPHVTGCCALLMEWGITQKNDLYLYSQKLKALLLQNARRSRNGTYPSDSNGYGFLDMSSIYFNRSDNDLSVKTKQQYKRLEYINNFIKKNRLNFKRQNDSYLNSIFVYFYNPEGFFNSLKISELESNFRRLSENSGIFSETDTEIILSGEFFKIEEVVSVESLSKMSLLSQVSSGTSGGFAINEDENIKNEWRLSHNNCIDPTNPEALNYIKEDIKRICNWGYTLIKHDFSTLYLFGRWGFQMSPLVTDDGWHFYDDSLTSAEVVKLLYKAILDASVEASNGETLILGCNTIGHLGAGYMHINRTGDDTSGVDWERTRFMGVNTLAFRLPQHGKFYEIDADCVGIDGGISWSMNKQWADVLAQSGTPLFISVRPNILDETEKQELHEILKVASKQEHHVIPVDWEETTCPEHWQDKDHDIDCKYQWFEETGLKFNPNTIRYQTFLSMTE